MIMVVDHWTGEDYKIETALLIIREVHEKYIDNNIADVAYSVMKEYRIEDKFGYFVGDNVSNNNTFIESLDQLMRDDDYEGFVFVE